MKQIKKILLNQDDVFVSLIVLLRELTKLFSIKIMLLIYHFFQYMFKFKKDKKVCVIKC